jgi:hypothetical protein
MYYVIQENLFREYGFKSLIAHLEKMGIEYEIVKYIPFSGELNVRANRRDVFFFGSSNAGMVAKEKYYWKPGHFIGENFNMEIYLEEYDTYMLNDDGAVWSVNSLNGLMECSKLPSPFFARPSGDSKEFTGQVFTRESWLDYAKDNPDLKTAIMTASPKTTQQEIRCWMVDGEPVTISQYKIGSRANYLNMDHNDEAVLFARQMAKIYQPARAFCLDICLWEDEYKIVELGCINHCGFYDANMGKLIYALEKMKF